MSRDRGVAITALVEDLKAVRTGLGIEDPNLVMRAGAAVRQVSGVNSDDSPGIVRTKIKTWLNRIISDLPEATAKVGRAMFGFDGPGDQPYLARLESLGRTMDREVRTMQRRADNSLRLIAEMASAHHVSSPGAAEPQASQPWHTTLVRVELILDQPEIEIFEHRHIVSHVNDLDEVRHWISIPPIDPAPSQLDLAGLGITLLSGGDMSTQPRLLSSSRVEIALRPPEPLNAGDGHEFFFRIRLRSLMPFYVCTPRFACDEFQLRVRFGREQLPERIWLIDGELPLEVGDPLPERTPLRADNSGEIQVKFSDLSPATSYGIRWQPKEHHASHLGTHIH